MMKLSISNVFLVAVLLWAGASFCSAWTTTGTASSTIRLADAGRTSSTLDHRLNLGIKNRYGPSSLSLLQALPRNHQRESSSRLWFSRNSHHQAVNASPKTATTSPPAVLQMAKKGATADDSEPTKKRSIAYRTWRIASYPVRKVGRLVFRRRKNKEDSATALANDDDDEEDAEIQEIIDSTVTTLSEQAQAAKNTVLETVETASENINVTASALLETGEKAAAEAAKALDDAASTIRSTVDESSKAASVIRETGEKAAAEAAKALDDAASTIRSTVDESSKAASQQLKAASSTLAAVTTSIGVGDRSPTAAKGVDLSGDWDLIVTEEFKQDYDTYLTLLGQPFFVRSVALSIVALTTEETVQTEQGVHLTIKGQNLRGTWERTLSTQGSAEIVTADGETVQSEAWWENGGRRHRSWLRGVEKYGGGSFESRRYLETSSSDSDKDILVCESIFHPNDETREKAQVTWRFQRKQAE